MNILLVNTQPVPSSGVGAASVNRILSYTKGLIEEGNDVRILSIATGKTEEWHEHEGVPVKHLGRTSKNKIIKVIKYFGTSCRLLKEISKADKDVVIFVTSNYFLTIMLSAYCKLTKTKVVLERSEFPFVLIRKSKLKRMLAPLYVNTAYKMLDGMILMTKPLMDYYQKKVRKGCRLFEMPMTVDIERFLNAESTPNTLGDYIAYCGSLSNTNGISNLIEAFSYVEPMCPNVKLVLIGGTTNEKEMESYKESVSKYGLHNVVFYGRVDRDKMPGLLAHAKALLLARRSNLQAAGGFPTKLGEYLATGNPVVITAVGDIPLYLNTNNSFIVKPEDNKAFGEKIIEVLSDDEKAASIGKEGEKLALTVFNGKEQSKKLNEFLSVLVASK